MTLIKRAFIALMKNSFYRIIFRRCDKAFYIRFQHYLSSIYIKQCMAVSRQIERIFFQQSFIVH